MTNATASSIRRFASSDASYSEDVAAELHELEPLSSFSTADYATEKIEAFDPVKRAKGRTQELPASRYDADGSGNGYSKCGC